MFVVSIQTHVTKLLFAIKFVLIYMIDGIDKYNEGRIRFENSRTLT